MKKRAQTPATKVRSPFKDCDLPVTKRLLDLTKQELKGDISSLRLEMRAGFAGMDARFAQQDAKFEVLQTQMTKMMVILEDQNDRNRAVLDGYTTVYERLHEHESRIEKLEKTRLGVK